MKSISLDTTRHRRCAVRLFRRVLRPQSLGLEIGTAFRMGPGYFPLFLAGVLILLGIVILGTATRVEGEPSGRLPGAACFSSFPPLSSSVSPCAVWVRPIDLPRRAHQPSPARK